jgi:hypothetical protein
VLELLGRGAEAPVADEEFGTAALAVFRHQYSLNAPYRAYCDARGATPERVDRWERVPAVPTDAFRSAPLTCGDPAAAVAVFRTSGTTAGAERRGAHHFRTLAAYDAALRAGFSAALLPDGARLPLLSLVPSRAEQPDSSLSHMLEEVEAAFGAAGGGRFVSGGELLLEPLVRRLEEAERGGGAVLLAGTSFAFVHLLDALEATGRSVRLPAGSRVMDTGGFKGRSREVPRPGLYAAIERRLGVAVDWCVNEYGMTEMSSQFYDGVAGRAGPVEGRRYRGPGWVRTRAYDPETLEPVPDGAVGVLRHWDLANVDSVMALQTADLGRVLPGGGFELLGRARGRRRAAARSRWSCC